MKNWLKFFFAWLLVVTQVMAAQAQVGLFIRNGTSSITSPTNGNSWVFDSGALNIKVWNGSSWQIVGGGGGSGNVNTAGGNTYTSGLQDFSNSAVSIVMPTYTADPGSPTSGQIWYNSTSNLFKYYNGSSVQVFATSTGNVMLGSSNVYTSGSTTNDFTATTNLRVPTILDPTPSSSNTSDLFLSVTTPGFLGYIDASQNLHKLAGLNLTQTFTGIQTFSTQPIVSGSTISVGGFTQTFPGNSDTLLNLTATQTGISNKTFTSPQITLGTTLTFLETSGNAIVTAANQTSGDQIYTIPNLGTNANFIMSAGSQTLGGNLTITNAPALSSGTILINSHTLTLPDPTSGGDSAAYLALTQTLTHKTLTDPYITADSVGIQFLSGSNQYNLTGNTNSPAASRTYSFYDAGGNYNVAIESGTPTAGAVAYGDGNKILFSSAGTSGYPLVSGGASAPSFAQINLASSPGLTGVLPIANGGTNNGSLAITAGGILYTDGTRVQNTGTSGVSAGYVLTWPASGTIPIWAAVSGTGTLTSFVVNSSASSFLAPSTAVTSGAVTLSAVGNKGDVPYLSAANTISNLAIGSNNTLMTVVSGVPAWTSATYPATITAGNVLYGSSLNVVSGLANGSIGSLLTQGSTSPSWLADVATGSYLRSAGTTTPPAWSNVVLPNTATLGDVWYGSATNVISPLGIGSQYNVMVCNSTPQVAWGQVNLAQSAAVTGLLGLTNGGTGASLSASNGGLLYSTGSALAILSGTATANQIPLSGSSSAPSWSTNTYPSTDAAGDIIYASGLNMLGGLTIGSSNQILIVSGGLPSWGTAVVGSGGTGLTTLTQYGVLLGEGTGNIHVTAAGTAGYPLVANSSADPTFQQLSLTTGVTGVLPIANGGTDNGSLSVTQGSVVFTDGTKLVSLAPGSAGQVLATQGASANPHWITLSSGGNVLTSSSNTYASGSSTNDFSSTQYFVLPTENDPSVNTANSGTGGGSIWVSLNASSANGGAGLPIAWWDAEVSPNKHYAAGLDLDQTFTNGLTIDGGLTLGTALTVANGGTGAGTFTTHGVMLGEGTAALHVTAAGTAGYFLTANSSADPTFQQINLGSSAGLTGQLTLALGGTNANLTAAAGAVAYSGASALALNTPAGSAGIPLVSGTSGTGAPTFSALNLAGGSSIITGALPVGNMAFGTAHQLLNTNSGATAAAWTSTITGITLASCGTSNEFTLGTSDTGIARNAQGIAEINGGVAGQFGSIYGGNHIHWALAIPGGITVTSTGTSNSKTWGYAVAAVLADGTSTAASVTVTTTSANGSTSLTSGNYQTIAWSAVSGATGYYVYRTSIPAGGSPSSTGIINNGAVVTSTSYADKGDTATGSAPAINSTGVIAMGQAGSMTDTGLQRDTTTLSGNLYGGMVEVDSSTNGNWGGMMMGDLNMQSLATPSVPTITTAGTPGSTHYAYKVTALTADGTVSTAASSASTTLTTGASTLNGTNYNVVALTAVTGATSYNIWRTTAGGSGNSGTTGLIGNTTSLTFNDQGNAGSGSAPSVNTTGDILWATDNSADIGQSGANRPRNLYLANNGVVGGTLQVSGNVTLSGTGNNVGTITTGIWNGTNIALANGGTNASLTATNGGLLYSTASAIAITSAPTAHGVLLGEGAAAPSWTAAGTAGYPLVANSGADPTFQQLSLTLGVTGTLPIANGGTDNGSLAVTAGGVIYTDGTKLQNVGAGTSGQYLESQGSSAPIWVTPSAGGGFGGNGADGSIAYTASTESFTGPIQKNATTFSYIVSSGIGTLTSTGGPIIINCTSTFTLGDGTHTINVNGTNSPSVASQTGDGASGGLAGAGISSYGQGGNGAGPGGGSGGGQGVSNNAAGGGGGFGGYGGGGGVGSATSENVNNGGQSYQSWINGGSGGGGGGYATTNANPGAGGAGGTAFIVCAVGAINLEASSNITYSGAAGAAGGSTTGNGGAGGSGGLTFLASQTSVTIAGGIAVDGGNGGAGSSTTGSGGGGGAPGRIVIWSPSNSTGSATLVLNYGTGGAKNGTATAGQNGNGGSNGTAQSITGNPNLPLITWALKTPEGGKFIDQLTDIQIALGHRYGKQNNIIDIDQKTLAWKAAHGSLEGFAYYMMGNMQGTTCQGVGNFDNNVIEVKPRARELKNVV